MTEIIYVYIFNASTLLWNEDFRGKPIGSGASDQNEPVKSLLEALPVSVQKQIMRVTPSVNRSMTLISQVLQRYVFIDIYYSDKCCHLPKLRDIVIKKTELGRPFWESVNDDDIFYDYNVSHHDGLVVLAVRKQKHIGIDLAVEADFLERGKDKNDDDDEEEEEEIKDSGLYQLFTNSELHSVKNGVTTYSQLWSLKESFVKASGLGVSHIFEDIKFQNLECDSILQLSLEPQMIELNLARGSLLSQNRYPVLKHNGMITSEKFISMNLSNGRTLSFCLPGAENVSVQFLYPTISDIENRI